MERKKVHSWPSSLIPYFAVWAALAIWFWVGMVFDCLHGDDIVLHSVILLTALPLASAVSGIMLVLRAEENKARLIASALSPVFFGLMLMLEVFVTYAAATALGKVNMGSPGSFDFIWGFCPAAIAVTAGFIWRAVRKSADKK